MDEDSLDMSIQKEFEDFLRADETLLGRVFRYTEEGLSPEEIGQREGTTTSNYVYNYLWIRDCMLKGRIPASPTPAAQIASRFRKIIRTQRDFFSTAAIGVLEERLRSLEEVAENVEAAEAEEADLIRQTEEAERQGVPGVYVYALPHYLRHPVDPKSGHTLLKVGHSELDAIKRAGGQRNTALPEDPVLLRVYPCEAGEARELERRFHKALEAADHPRSSSRSGGTEYYLTTVKFLDEIARLLGVEVRSFGPDTDYFD